MAKQKKDWFRIEEPKALAGQSSADVYVYDVIGGSWFSEGVTASAFTTELAALNVDQINLFVNSPGGDVYQAIAMTNALRRHPANVTATVDGLAASAASFLITGADDVVMGQNSELMIHDAWSIAMGNAQDMRDMADDLDRISGNIASMYAAKAGGTADEWRQIMRSETWLSADEAVTAGIADRVDGAADTDAEDEFDLSRFAYAGRSRAPKPPIDELVAMQRKPKVTLKADVSEFVAGIRATNDNPTHPEPGTEPEDPAPTTQEEAVTETPATTPQAPADAPESQAFNLADLTSAIKDAFKEQPIQAVIPAVPSSLAVAKADEPKGPSFAEAMNIFAARKTGTAPAEASHRVESTLTNGSEVFASLTNVGLNVNGNTGGLVNTVPPQWIGELVARVPYSGLWDLVSHDDLTSPNITAFTMTTVPTGGTKGDNGAAVVSTGAKWGPVNTPALRWAGADSFDRTIFDFGLSATAMSSYFRAQLFNYYQWRDSALITAMTAGLTAVAAEAAPTGSAITTIVNQIIDGVVNVEVKGGGVANLAVVTASEFKSLAKNSREQAPAFLTLDLGALTQGDLAGKLTVRPDPTGTLATGDVLVANGAGVTGYELPGSPVRAEQVQVSIGNIDVGLFGYAAAIAASTNFFSLVAAPAS